MVQPRVDVGHHSSRLVRGPTSAAARRGVEVILMGAAVILTFPKQQHLGRVPAGSTGPRCVTRQTLAVTRCQRRGSGQVRVAENTRRSVGLRC